MKHALVIGGGPAGLMAAEELSRAGVRVTVKEAKRSLGRKFLMAGKSGLNITKDEPFDQFCAQYSEAKGWLTPSISKFSPSDVMQFAEDLDQPVFKGSSGRIFPKAMKASPFLRSWIKRLTSQGVTFETGCRWVGWNNGDLVFETANGKEAMSADAIIFALGGASWARLGSDGHWAKIFAQKNIALSPFGAANAGISIAWSTHMAPNFGTPIKAVAFSSGNLSSRGEAILSERGLEGSGVYSVSRAVREGNAMYIDLRPDWSIERVQAALERPRGSSTFSNHMRRVLKLKKHEIALLNEWARPLPTNMAQLAEIIKGLRVQHKGLHPIDEAISTSGGVMRAALNDDLMLRRQPGVFCAGEMLDWEAPTGGYLLTACFATGRTAGRGAVRYLGLNPTP